MSDVQAVELSPRTGSILERGSADASKASRRPQGIGRGESSLESSDRPVDEEQPVENLRFCALLDCLLPQSVVIYLEEVCLCVYSWVLTTFCRAGDQPPQPVELPSQQNSEQPAETPLLQAQQQLLKGREARKRRPYNGGAEVVQERGPTFVQTMISQRAGDYFSTQSGAKYRFTDPQIVKGKWEDNNLISIAEDFQTQDDGSYFAENLTNGSQTRITPVR